MINKQESIQRKCIKRVLRRRNQLIKRTKKDQTNQIKSNEAVSDILLYDTINFMHTTFINKDYDKIINMLIKIKVKNHMNDFTLYLASYCLMIESFNTVKSSKFSNFWN